MKFIRANMNEKAITAMPKLGTAALVAPVNPMGVFPSYNARKGVLDGWEKICREAMAE